ncbi:MULTISPECIES: phosphate/phosphite/phosphonate ABC transporter substrate-binding protein [Corynebacterium]|uniref:phosphate/phosphite/phosphonate ABC transporter substrate-binding protein n=1 Tax=Corynebacterium TaxID=1716 RepID=UPI0012B91D7B|nr:MULTISPECIES: phosphate/phosphite/phosphonate ABC transporter substrate-binding protein [Corynebacterium]MDK6807978.1 phosphate/phosphite/phosphonate ABC transporter substrate-binding protein [Corynebacterium aurimucosum]MDK8897845.1 phosphate/phosphite/phosphonate ABC transporter substrate-binding protein [Corynebacterium sp. MSK004]MTD97519.1 phosphate/phosphite/phosphonate ABC transporter substrate-binding protein [Corynebacterium guaraldiae]NJJ83921.1 phosphate/phosphite/phosphonate ABC 
MRRFTALAASALALSLSLTACSSDSSSTDDSNSPDKLTLALIPNEKVNDLVTTAKPLTDYLSEELGIEVEGVVTKDYQAAVEAIGSGQADIAIASAAQLASAEDMYGAHAVLQDERFGADSYAGQFVTNNPDKYCEDEPVASTYAASGADYLYCNGTATPEENKGQGPKGLEALKKIDGETTVAMLGATSPAGYQLPVMAMESQGIDVDSLKKVPVTSNDASIMAVYNGDAEVGFSFWDARSTIDASEAPDLAEKLVVFGYTDMYPNGGVVISDEVPEDLRGQITDLMDGFSEVDPDTMSAIFDITDWVPAKQESIDMARKVNERFAQ